jgi:hypothetical protein
VYLNGQKIGEGASSAAGKRLKVPKGILEKSVFNTLAVRLEKDARFVQAPVFRTYFDELVLAGDWQTFSGETDALKPLAQEPKTAVFTEKGFRLSTMPLVATENMPGQRLSPAESLAKMRTEPGLAVELLLAEPLVAQPTHMSFDERGRLWVSQYRQYPYPAGIKQLSRDQYYRAVFDKVPPPPPNHDRGADIISVHEDTDGDGVFDKHKNVLEHAVSHVLPGQKRRRHSRRTAGSSPRGLWSGGHPQRRKWPRMGAGRLALRRAGQHGDLPRETARCGLAEFARRLFRRLHGLAVSSDAKDVRNFR